MWGLALGDIIVVTVYFVIVYAIGFWAMKRNKTSEDYFMGGRSFGKVVQVFSAFGQATSADTGPSVATNVSNNGASGIWAAMLMLFSTPTYWFTGVWYRRLRTFTMADYFVERFQSKLLGGVYSLLGGFSLMILLSVGFIGVTKTVMIMTPKSVQELTVSEKSEYEKAKRLESLETVDYKTLTPDENKEMSELRIMNPRKNFSHIDRTIFIWIVVIVVITFTLIGGLKAAFVSDVLQGAFILILSIMLLPFAISQINDVYGGSGFMDAFRTIHDQLPESYFEIFGSPYAIDFTWYYIAAISVLAAINVAVGPNQLVVAGSAKNEYTARYGLTFGTYLKRIAIVLWGVTSLSIVVLYRSKLEDQDMMWGYASKALLSPANMGLIGLMIAAFMASILATSGMMMLTTGSLITYNMYKPLVPNKSDNHYTTFGRFAGASVVIGAALMVIGSDSILGQLKLNWEFGAIYAAGFWLGILWKRTNRTAVWVSIILTAFIFFITPMVLPWVNSNIYHSQSLLLKTKERIESRSYTAHQMDITQRNSDIARWETNNAMGKAIGARPDSIHEGQKFTKDFKLPQKSVFWSQGISIDENGNMKGKGNLKMSLLFYAAIGFDLSENEYAMNETIDVITKILFPFIIVFLVSYFTKRSKKEEEIIDSFYVRMKTPVTGDKEVDERELALSYENPKRFDNQLVFPKTDWQFCKWTKTDFKGFMMSMGLVVAILFMLWFFVNLGGKIGGH